MADGSNEPAGGTDAGESGLDAGVGGAAPVKRGRGRPRGSKNGSGNLASDGGAGGRAGDAGDDLGGIAPAVKSRTRPGRSSGAAAPAPDLVLTPEAIDKRTGSLLTAHMVLAAWLGPHWQLAPDKARALAVAMLGVEAQYAITVNPKLAALASFGAVAAATYGPMLGATLAQTKARAQQQRARAAEARGFGGGAPNQPSQPVPPTADTVVGGSGVVIFPTGKPDAGKIDFGG